MYRFVFGVASVLGVASCGDVKSMPDASPKFPDAAAQACDFGKPFGMPAPVTAVNTAAHWETGGTLSVDRLTLYFSSNNSPDGVWSIYYTTRPDVNSEFGVPVLLPGVAVSGQSQIGPVISNDGLSLYLTQFAHPDGLYDIFVSIRNSLASEFAAPQRLVNVNDLSQHDSVSYIDPTGTILYLSRGVGAVSDIYRATRTGASAAFGAPVPVAELNVSGALNGSAVLTGDGLTVYFTSDRPGGRGCWDVMKAQRSTMLDGFGAPTRVAELSTGACEAPAWLSPDGCEMVMHMLGNPSIGGHDLFTTSRPQ